MMFRKFCICTIVAGLTAAAADSPESRMLGPMLGYAQTSSGVRPIVGVPGAAFLGAAVDPSGLKILAVSATLDYAVGSAEETSDIRLVHLRTGAISALSDVPAGALSVRLSPRGTAAIFVYESGIRIVSGLPAAARAAKVIDMAGVTQAAVSDDGETLVIARDKLLTVFHPAGQRDIGLTQPVRSIRFGAGVSGFLYTDGLSVYTETGEIIAGSAQGLADIRLAAFSADGQSVLIADAQTSELLLTKTSGEVQARLPLSCSPSELELMKDSTMRLQCENGGRMHLVDGSGPGARILFVPDAVE